MKLLFDDAAEPRSLLVLAHGAGAGMRHPFMAALAANLAALGVSTARYEFAYMEAGSKRVDSPAAATARVREAAAEATRLRPGLPLFAGGKSFGGRMTSTAQVAQPLEGVRGLVFAGFPLHPPGKPATTRADHLRSVRIPMLFLQGTRDEFAPLDLLQPVVTALGETVRLHLIDGANHGFAVKGRKSAAVIHELARTASDWMFRAG